jgi:hypothetical protein
VPLLRCIEGMAFVACVRITLVSIFLRFLPRKTQFLRAQRVLFTLSRARAPITSPASPRPLPDHPNPQALQLALICFNAHFASIIQTCQPIQHTVRTLQSATRQLVKFCLWPSQTYIPRRWAPLALLARHDQLGPNPTDRRQCPPRKDGHGRPRRCLC